MHLTDCFAPVMRYMLRFRESSRDLHKSAEQVRTRLLDLLARAEDLALQAGFPVEEYHAARLAVCSWIDDLIQKSSWPHRDDWQKNVLLKDGEAVSDGADFMERLGELPPHRREAREIFYLCLALGYTGSCGEGSAALEKVRGAQLTALNGSASELLLQDKDLFVGGYPQDLPVAKDTGALTLASLPALAALAAPLFLVAVLLFCYRLSLSTLSESVLKSLPF